MIFRIFSRLPLIFTCTTRKLSNMESHTSSDFKFVWIDCEMTGLDPERDTLLEVACIVSDSNLNEISEGAHVVIHQPSEILEKMNEWCQNTHQKSGLYQACLESKCSIKEAEQQLLTYVRKHTEKGKCYFAGNSVYMDVLFLKKYMPELVNHTYYRLLDVSTVKILSGCWYGRFYEKKYLHQALSDVKESIEELKYFRKNIFK